MSSTRESHLFCCRALQIRTGQPLPTNGIKVMSVIFSLSEQTVVCNKDTGVNTYSEPNLKTKRRTSISLPRHICRRVNKKILAQNLSSMGVPRVKQERIIKTVYKLVRIAVPEFPLLVIIVDVTVAILGCFEDDPDYISRTRSEIRESIETSIYYSFAHNTNNVTPAATSSIEHLEKVRLYGLEEATLRQNPCCAICLQDFAEGPEELITCLPCKHYYHLACIVKSLKIRHTCPLCRRPVPIIAEVLGKTREVFVCRYGI